MFPAEGLQQLEVLLGRTPRQPRQTAATVTDEFNRIAHLTSHTQTVWAVALKTGHLVQSSASRKKKHEEQQPLFHILEAPSRAPLLLPPFPLKRDVDSFGGGGF